MIENRSDRIDINRLIKNEQIFIFNKLIKIIFRKYINHYKIQVLIILFHVSCLTTYSQNDFNTSKGFGVEVGSIGKTNFYTISGQGTYKFGKQFLFVGFYVDQFLNTRVGEYGPYLGYRIYPHKNDKKIKLFYQTYLNLTKTPKYRSWNGYFFGLGTGLQYEILQNLNIGADFNLGYGYVTSNTLDNGWNFWIIQPHISISYKFTKTE